VPWENEKSEKFGIALSGKALKFLLSKRDIYESIIL